MHPASKPPRPSAVLKLGRYVLRCLTAQPDIWFLFLYKCGQLVAVNLHEPVARSVGLLDELFQESHLHQQQHARHRPATGPPSSAPPQPPPPDNDQHRGMDDGDDTDDGGRRVRCSVTDDDDDDYDRYDYEDDDDDDDEDPYAFLTRHPFAAHGRCGSSGRRSSSCCSRRSSVTAGGYFTDDAAGIVTVATRAEI